MFNHVWSVLCERISVDKDTGLISYLTSVEDITAQKLPSIIKNLSFGSRWFKMSDSKDILNIRLSLIRPDETEQELIKTDDLKIDPKLDNIRLNFALDNLQVKEKGIYVFRLERKKDNNWQVVSETPLKVQFVPANNTREAKEGSSEGSG